MIGFSNPKQKQQWEETMNNKPVQLALPFPELTEINNVNKDKQFVLPFTKADILKNICIKLGKTLDQITDEVIAEIRKSLKKDLAEIKFAHSDMKNNFNMRPNQIRAKLEKEYGWQVIRIYWHEYGDR
jgi:hypothetical protein